MWFEKLRQALSQNEPFQEKYKKKYKNPSLKIIRYVVTGL